MRTYSLCFLLMTTFSATAQTFTEEITRDLSFEKLSSANALMIANLHGDVKVEAYEGNAIVITATRTIYAKTDERLEKGKAEVQLGVIDRADTLIVYVMSGCHEFRRTRENHSRGHFSGWNYHSDNRGNCDQLYDFKMDFRVKVPATVNLVVSTINEGNVEVENVSGIVRASNINGGIRLSNLKSQASATTINGDVNIEYANTPSKECRFYTLNGNINAVFPTGLSADLSFESFNGDFYTNLEGIETLPAQIEKSERGEGLRYKISGNQFRVRNGGPLLAFETFNGNVYLKEK